MLDNIASILWIDFSAQILIQTIGTHQVSQESAGVWHSLKERKAMDTFPFQLWYAVNLMGFSKGTTVPTLSASPSVSAPWCPLDFHQAKPAPQSRWQLQKNSKAGCSRPPITLPCFLFRCGIWRRTAACSPLPPKPAAFEVSWWPASIYLVPEPCVWPQALLHSCTWDWGTRSPIGPTQSTL